MPWWKFNESEMKGYPVRLEIGPRDIENEQVVLVRRDTGEKEFVSFADLAERLPQLLEEIQQNLYDQAAEHRKKMTHSATNIKEFQETLEEKSGYIKAMWGGSENCEEGIQDETGATSRGIPI